ncbi:MAG: hypothetical protein AB1894_24970 [Chloroflexota bacterium]
MDTDTDLHLLRRFEPVLHLTRGEKFFPMDVEPYVQACSLWVQRPNEDAICLIPQDELTLEALSEPRPGGADVVYYLRFIEPLDVIKLIAYLQEQRKKTKAAERFQAGPGRLARVGYSSRFADLLFSLSLLLRGRVPGDTSAAAAIEYQQIQSSQNHYCYHGRVVRQGGWIVLQYWYFYAFNNWRSAFFGVNDHEADWEMVNIYLYQDDSGEYVPEWAAYASHDFSGDDLRRRWDDPELQKVGEHPVVFVGAGSHASYYTAGEYLAEIELPFLWPLARATNWLHSTWDRWLGRDSNRSKQANPSSLDVFRVPFVDYARGDGPVIGAEGDHSWCEPRLIGPEPPPWVSQYAGLWGLYAHDPISGENAPAGPMYNRDGTIRRVWYDPLGWAGLDKLPPPCEALKRLREEQQTLQQRLEQRNEEIDQKSADLARLGLMDAALGNRSEWLVLEWEQRKQIQALSQEVEQLRAQQAVDHKMLEALQHYENRLLAGERDPARDHIQRAHRPASANQMRVNRLVELWAALSVGLLMIGFVSLVLFYSQHILLGLVVMISIFIFIESGFRRQIAQLINSLAIGLAIVSALVILFEFFWKIVIGVVLAAGVYILWENLRELRH